MTHWDDLLDVQQHDTTIDQLRHRSRTLPERAQLDEATRAIAGLDAQLASLDERRGEISRAQNRIEDEIATLGDKAAAEEKRLYSGSFTVPKELQALQEDIDHIRARVRRLEDDELELMEQAEPLDAERDVLLQRRGVLDVDAQRATAVIAEAESAIDAEVATLTAERERAIAGVPPALVAEYERLRERLGGIAIARLNGTSCGGCHLQLSAVEIDRIKGLDPDEPVHCEECGRLLVRSA